MTTDLSTLQQQIDALTEELYGKLPLVITPPVNPISQLPAKRQEQLQQFQERITATTDANHWYTVLLESSKTVGEDIESIMNNPITYYRFLKGYQWDEKLVEEKLKNMCEFRIRERPSQYSMEMLEAIGRTKFVTVYGYDKQYRPTVYVNMKQIDKLSNWDSEENLVRMFKYVVYITETAIERMSQVHPHVFQANWIIDMNDASLGLSTVKKGKDIFLQLGDIHPERLYSAVICNVTWTLNILWNFIKYLLTEETIAKYKFVKKGNDTELKRVVSDMIDLQYMLQHVGGPVKDPFNVDKIKALEKLKKQMAQNS